MDSRKKRLLYLTLTLALSAVVALVVSLATDFWVVSTPRLHVNGSLSEKYSKANFGLFKGFRNIDYGLSGREHEVKVVCEPSRGVCVMYPVDYKDTGQNEETGLSYIDRVLNENASGNALYTLGLFSYGCWVTCILSAAFSITFGLITVAFTIFNIYGKPIETITGPKGLYVWNGIAFFFALLELILFLVLFLITWKKNFLEKETFAKFDVSYYTNMGYSFYLVLVAFGLYLVNIIILFCSGYKIPCLFRAEAEKVVDSGVILY